MIRGFLFKRISVMLLVGTLILTMNGCSIKDIAAIDKSTQDYRIVPMDIKKVDSSAAPTSENNRDTTTSSSSSSAE